MLFFKIQTAIYSIFTNYETNNIKERKIIFQNYTGTFFLFVKEKWSIFPRTCPLRLGNLKPWINLQFDLWSFLWRSSIVPLRPFTRQKNRVRTHRKSDTDRTILAAYSCSTSSRTKSRLVTKFERLRLHCTFWGTGPIFKIRVWYKLLPQIPSIFNARSAFLVSPSPVFSPLLLR